MSELFKTALSEEDIERMHVTAEMLAQRGNMLGQAIVKGMEGKTAAERRILLIMAYAQAYEALVALNMALQSTVQPGEVRRRLDETNRGAATPASEMGAGEQRLPGRYEARNR